MSNIYLEGSIMISKDDEKIIEMICLELTNKEIARYLCYSEATIVCDIQDILKSIIIYIALQ